MTPYELLGILRLVFFFLPLPLIFILLSRLRGEISRMMGRLPAFPGVCIYVRPSRVSIFVKVKYKELRKTKGEGDLDRLEEVTDKCKPSSEGS